MSSSKFFKKICTGSSMPPVLLLLLFLLQIKPALLLRLVPFPAAAFVFGFHLFPLGCERLLGFGTDSGLSQEFGLHLRAIDFAGGGKFKAAPHNSAAKIHRGHRHAKCAAHKSAAGSHCPITPNSAPSISSRSVGSLIFPFPAKPLPPSPPETPGEYVMCRFFLLGEPFSTRIFI